MTFHTMLADPPWNETGGGRIKRGADRHYTLMKVEDIITFLKKIEMAADSHLYLWVTNNHLPEGLQVMKALGFTYKTNLVWVKDRFGLGQYFRGQHELCLFGTRGSLPYKSSISPSRSSCTIPSVIFAPRTEHSRKPEELYDIIEKTSYPEWVEVFARYKRHGWNAIGDQVQETLG